MGPGGSNWLAWSTLWVVPDHERSNYSTSICCFWSKPASFQNFFFSSFFFKQLQCSQLHFATRCVFVLQVRTFYTQVLNEDERQRLCENMAGALKGAQLFIQKRMVSPCCASSSRSRHHVTLLTSAASPVSARGENSAIDAAAGFRCVQLKPVVQQCEYFRSGLKAVM